MYDDNITPQQAVELLEQAENGELDLDNLGNDSQDEQGGQDEIGIQNDNSEQTDDGQDTPPQEQSQDEKPPVDYMAILAQERARTLALQDELAKYQQSQNGEQPQEQAAPQEAVSLEELFGDFDEKGIKNAVEYLAAKRVDEILAEKLTPIEQKHAQDAYQEHINAITAVHPDAGQIVNSDEFANWVKSQPSYIQPSIVNVVEQGSAQQVNELLTNYKASITPQQTQQNSPQNGIQAKAEQIIADIKPSVPNSLTDLGGANPTDPMQALVNMNGAQALDTLQGMSQEQIEHYLNRL